MRCVSLATTSRGPSGIPRSAESAVEALVTAAGESTPDIPNHADANSSVLGGREIGSIDGGETHVFSALDTATRTASVNAAADMYAKLDEPPKARPRMVPDLSAMTADVLEPP